MFFLSILPLVWISARGVTANGDWNVTVNEFNLTGGAGTGLTGTYTSAAAQTTLTVWGVGNWNWRIDIYKVDNTWSPAFTLYARRTSGTASGGTTYQVVTDVSQPFFTGSNPQSGLGIQYRLQGVSLAVPVNSYSVTVYYTMTQL